MEPVGNQTGGDRVGKEKKKKKNLTQNFKLTSSNPKLSINFYFF